jgi:hypothetical protein
MFDEFEVPLWVRLIFGLFLAAVVSVLFWSVYFKYDGRWVTSFVGHDSRVPASLDKRDDELWDIQLNGERVARAAMQSTQHGVYEFKVVESSGIKVRTGQRFSLLKGGSGELMICSQCQQPYESIGSLLPIVWHLAD